MVRGKMQDVSVVRCKNFHVIYLVREHSYCLFSSLFIVYNVDRISLVHAVKYPSLRNNTNPVNLIKYRKDTRLGQCITCKYFSYTYQMYYLLSCTIQIQVCR